MRDAFLTVAVACVIFASAVIADEVLEVTVTNQTQLSGVEQTEIYGPVILIEKQEGETLTLEPRAIVKLVTPEKATVDVLIDDEDRVPTPYDEIQNIVEDGTRTQRLMIGKAGKHYIDVVVLQLVEGQIVYKRHRDVATVGGTNPTDPTDPPPSGDFGELEKKSNDLSAALNDPVTRTQLGQALSRESFGETIQLAIRNYYLAYQDVQIRRERDPGSQDVDWKTGWWDPIFADIQALINDGAITTVGQLHQAFQAIAAGLK